MSQEQTPELVEYHLPECDTVGFEIDHFPAPLEWNGGKFQLSWAHQPALPAADAAKWDAVIAEVQQMISGASAAHFPAEDAVITGLKPGPWEPPGALMLLDIKALRSILPLAVQADPLVVRNLKVVKRHIQMMRKGAVW